MYRLSRFMSQAGNNGKPLPSVFPILDHKQIQFRHGGTSMVAGAPGSFKSITALNLAVGWARQGKGILYFSFDSDRFTVTKRVSGILTGYASGRIEDDFVRDDVRLYTEALKAVDGINFVDRNLDMDGMVNHIGAYEAIHGTWPDIIFVDNLINTVDDPTDWGGMISVIRELDQIARETQAHICFLHHSSEAWSADHPGMPPPSHSIQGKVSQIPRLVLTVAADGLQLRMACVKNTNGPGDAQARNFMQFAIEPSLRVVDEVNRQPV